MKPPRHGASSASGEPAAPKQPQPLPDAPCLSPACHGHGAVATLLGDEDPFVVPHSAAPSGQGRGEDLASPALVSVTAPAVPEPPPPRA